MSLADVADGLSQHGRVMHQCAAYKFGAGQSDSAGETIRQVKQRCWDTVAMRTV